MTLSASLPLDDIIGREHEIEDVDRLLDSARLVTITGLGGVGKTRVAQEVARGRNRAGAVAFVDLSTVLRADQVPELIADVLDLDESAGATPNEAVSHALAQRDSLLILDSFEHVLGAANLVRELLSAAPGLSILITSRLALRLAGEREFPLGPLGLPATDDWASVAASASGRVFIQEAERIGSSFVPADGPSVAEICLRLGGIPLGLRLGAARTRLFSPAALAERLRLDMPTLPHPAAATDPLSAIITWTADLLDEPDRRRFEALGVLPGPFGVAVAGALWDLDDPLDLLDALLHLGLIRRTDANARFELLAPVREHARRQLHARGDEAAVMAALSRWALATATAFGRGLRDGHQIETLDGVHVEMPTLRMVIDRETVVDPPIAAEIVAALDGYWLRTALRDGLDVAQALLGRPMVTDALSARLLEIISNAERVLVGREPAIEHGLMMLDIAVRIGDRAIESRARFVLGMAHTGEPAIVELRQAAELARAIDDPLEEMHILGNLGVAYQEVGDGQAALAALVGATAAARRVEDRFALAMNLANLAEALLIDGRLGEAEAAADEAASIFATVGPLRFAGFVAAVRAGVAARQGRIAEASAGIAAASKIAESLGGLDDWASVIDYAGLVRLSAGRPREAARLVGLADRLREMDADQEPIRSPIATLVAGELEALLGDRVARAIDAGRTDDIAAVLGTLADPPAVVAVHAAHGRLSPREIEVLRLVADGATDPEIAEVLVISPKTASVHVSNLRDKLGSASRIELAFEGRRLLDADEMIV